MFSRNARPVAFLLAAAAAACSRNDAPRGAAATNAARVEGAPGIGNADPQSRAVFGAAGAAASTGSTATASADGGGDTRGASARGDSPANDGRGGASTRDAGDARSPGATAGATADATDPAFATAKPLSAKSIGHTSVVLKVRLEGGLDAAYKPRSKRGDRRYRGEVAAYRLARALGLPNVPPAYVRAFDAEALRAAIGAQSVLAEIVPEPDGRVLGALIPWIRGLDFLPLEKEPWSSRWREWLSHDGSIPEDERALAAQIATMIAFDYVTGNWDRWSGGNVGIDATRTTLLFVDNDGAFFDPPPADALARQLRMLETVDRFPRGFVQALRAVDVGAAIGEEVPGRALLTARVIAQVEARRRRAVGIVEAKIARWGERAVLAFE